ncbi:hypothetical protein BH10PSE1_BH10PSE1_14830 [soil metagenome]
MAKLSPDTSPLPPKTPWSRSVWIVAPAIAAFYALAIYLWTRQVAPYSGMLLIAFIIGAPVAACVVAVWISDPKGVKGTGSHVGTSALTVTIMLTAAGVALREGAVCLVMAAPIFYLVGILAGWITGSVLRRRGGRMMCAAILVLPLIGVPLEHQADNPAETRYVTSSTVIHAAPSVVWQRLVDVKTINEREHSWNFTHDLVGIPRPLDARMDGTGVGAVRHLTWARGVRFEELIVEWKPDQALAWTFEVGPEASTRMLDEHLRVNSAYLRLEQGRYTLTPTDDGQTRLVLTTRYWMKTPINSYAGWWGRIFLGDFHRNVLGVIKDRAEQV